MNRSGFAVVCLIALSGALAGCGHSEEEWQVQVAKYQTAIVRTRQAQQSMSHMQAELAAAKARVTRLEQQLRSMGLEVGSAPTEGADEGDMGVGVTGEMRRALDEYRSRAVDLEALQGLVLSLRQQIEDLKTPGVLVSVRQNRVRLVLPADALFDGNRADIKPDGKKLLLQVAQMLREEKRLAGRDIQVATHTDNRPYGAGPFTDNLGLSAMRSRQIAAFLAASSEPSGKKAEAGGGLAPNRLSAAGYGENDPLVPNDTDENRKANRRVELVFMPLADELPDLRQAPTPR